MHDQLTLWKCAGKDSLHYFLACRGRVSTGGTWSFLMPWLAEYEGMPAFPVVGLLEINRVLLEELGYRGELIKEVTSGGLFSLGICDRVLDGTLDYDPISLFLTDCGLSLQRMLGDAK